jgi:hypothetical protein
MKSSVWNPRYVAYARASGKHPSQMLSLDRKRYPGGRMSGFIRWIDSKWRKWDQVHAHPRDHVRTVKEHDDFTAWLLADVEVSA